MERRTYPPKDFGVREIGHMGFFRRGQRDRLWTEVLGWLQERQGESAR